MTICGSRRATALRLIAGALLTAAAAFLISGSQSGLQKDGSTHSPEAAHSGSEASTPSGELPPHRGFWPTLQIAADEAESYASLVEMAKAADLVVVGRMSNFRLNRRIQGDSPEHVVHMAAVDIDVEQAVRGVAPGKHLVLEFLLLGRPHEIAAKVQQQAASLPQAPMLFFLRHKGGSETGLCRLVNHLGLWLADEGAVRAPLSLALHEPEVARTDGAPAALGDVRYAGELATLHSLQELVEHLAR